ncbi:MAG: hypothetical protein K0S75_2370 [Clostridia bacterium]|jgi:hypothetical protein|nr:hypothetical protein [Clostridia bacterium]
MNLDTSLAPKFVVFHYFINWFIQQFGSIPYFIGVVGGIGGFCAYAFSKCIKEDKWDQAIMIVIFACVLVGGLIGLGIDISNGYAFDPLLNE